MKISKAAIICLVPAALILASCGSQVKAPALTPVTNGSFREDSDYNMTKKKYTKNVNMDDSYRAIRKLEEQESISGNDIPADTVSSPSISDDAVSGNTVSGISVSDTVSKNILPEKEVLQAKIRVGGKGTETDPETEEETYTLDSVTPDAYKAVEGGWELVSYDIECTYYTKDKTLRDEIYDLGNPLTETEIEYTVGDDGRRWLKGLIETDSL